MDNFAKKRMTSERPHENTELGADDDCEDYVDPAQPDFAQDIYRLVVLFQQVTLDYHRNVNVLPTLALIRDTLAVFLATYHCQE